MPRLHFLKENLAASATGAMALLPYGGTDYYAQRAGRVRSVTALLTEARAAGSLTVKVTKNGAAQTALNLTIDGSATQFDEAFGDRDDLVFAAGDRLGVQAVTSGFGPTTSDAIAVLDLDEGV
jgi:hypothetical protein